MKHQAKVSLVLLAFTTHFVVCYSDSSACQISQCWCTNSASALMPDVMCLIKSISTMNPIIEALPATIKSLTFSCTDPTIPSFLQEGVFEKFIHLQSLAVQKCNITVMSSSSFQGLGNLSSLFISNSDLPQSLPPDTFSHLSHLKSLTISNCNLQSLPRISQMLSLQYLNISNNNLQYIEPFVHEDPVTSEETDNPSQENMTLFTNLTVVDVSYNNISTMPSTFLRRTPNLQNLFLSNLRLKHLVIPQGLILKNLTVLNAKGNLLEKVDFPGLSRTCKLEELYLEGTGHPVYLNGLSSLHQLVKLTLSNFAVNDTVWSLLNSSALTKLDLTNNKLSSIEVTHLPSLMVFLASQNEISNLNTSTFINQPVLLGANISHNSISSLPTGLFDHNVNLRALDLGYNNITSLGFGSLRGLNQLFYLDISHNHLSRLPYTVFKDLSSLLYLYLQGNSLQFLPQLSYMSELNTLNISDNQISSLQPSDFEGLDNLELLFAHDNKIRVVPDDLFLHNPALLQVSLQNNQLTQLGTFGEHPNLIALRLDNNYLTGFGVESPFIHMKSLQYLFLDQNNLTSITPNMFPPTLHNLILNENDISYIHGESFKDLPNINSVSLMFNKYVLSIMLVTVSRFNKHNPKPTFYIGGNVFLCDCFMGYMKVIQEDGYSRYAFYIYYPRFRGLETSSCMTPYEGNAVRPMSEVPLSHFVCSYNETYCDVGCDCCFDSGPCDCALTCPGNCECFSGGFTLKKGYIHIHCSARNLTFIPDEIPSRAVTLHLDGNNFTSFSKLGLSHLRDTEVLYLNGSHIETIEDGAFDNISALAMLHLQDNLLSAISEHLFGNLANLKQIFLHNNLISKIAPNAFAALLSVETITLHNNRLTLLESVPTVPTLLSMTLSKNPWTCSCNITSENVILKVFRTLSRIIVDKERMCCHGYHTSRVSASGWAENISSHDVTPSNRTGQNMEGSNGLSVQGSPRGSTEDCFPLMHFRYEDMCIEPLNSTHLSAVSRAGLSSGVIALIITTVMLVVLAVAVVVVLVRRQELQAWAFVQLGIRVFDKKAQIDKEDAGTKAFDAFISYSSKDDEFVATTLVPALEEGNRRYRVCVHYRDFPVGQTIADTIVRAIENSSRTILLLSENFLHSEWCRFEFQTAHRHILREGSHRLIIVILGEVKEDMLDPDLKVHMKSKTYLKFGDPWFWEKLYFALPDTKGREQNEEERNMDVLRGMRILAGQEDNTHEVKGRGQPHGAELAEHEPEVGGQVCHEYSGKELKNVNLKKMLDKDFTDIYDIFPKKTDVNIFHVDNEDVNLNVYKGNKWEENENRRRGHFQDKESNVDKQFENSVNEENDHIVNGLDRYRPTVTIESHVDCENGKNDTDDEDGDSLRENDNNIVPQVVKHPSCDNSTEVNKKADDNSAPCSSIDSGILVSCSEEQPLKSSDKILECSTDIYNCNIVGNDDIEQKNYQHDDVIHDDYDIDMEQTSQCKDTLDNDDVEQTYPCSELDKDDIEQTYPYFVDNGCEVSFINGQQGTNLDPVSKDSELTICKVTNTLQNGDKRVMTTDLDLLKEEIV